jgi:hypothetical protein
MAAADAAAVHAAPVKPAALTGEFLMRGRSRARDLVSTQTDLDPPKIPTAQEDTPQEGTAATAHGGRRSAGLLIAWVAVFFATFFIGLNFIE